MPPAATRYTVAMARGRKRLIAGWGLLGVGAAMLSLLTWSGWNSLVASWCPTATQYHLRVRDGFVTIAVQTLAPPDSQKWSVQRRPFWEVVWWLEHHTSEIDWSLGVTRGTALAGFATRWGGRVWGVQVMVWPLVALAWTASVFLFLNAHVVRRRRRVGLCRFCGYDMKGLAAGAGCPECGKAPAVR